MADWQAERRMIERRPLIPHPVVGQGLHERDECGPTITSDWHGGVRSAALGA